MVFSLEPALTDDSLGLKGPSIADHHQHDCAFSFYKLGLWDMVAIFQTPLKSFCPLGGILSTSKILALEFLGFV